MDFAKLKARVGHLKKIHKKNGTNPKAEIANKPVTKKKLENKQNRAQVKKKKKKATLSKPDKPQTPEPKKKGKKRKKKTEASDQNGPKKKKRKFAPDNLDQMKTKLTGGKFRWINEKLYTTSSKEAKDLFSEKKGLKHFQAYHKGFSDQVQTWEVNPVDAIIDWINTIGAKTDVIADLGCGEAKIAEKVKQTVHSFDFVALKDHVTVADMANVPLENASVDLAVMCLSLMGTNYTDFIREANRILKPSGLLKVAEVKSRFKNLETFMKLLRELGFNLVEKETPNDYFVLLEFKKVGKPKKRLKNPSSCLEPCVYKKR